MKKSVLKIIFAMFGVLLLAGGLAQAGPVTIQISGNVTSASGSALPGTIHTGSIFTGTYTYDSLATSSIDGDGAYHYIHNAPYGISLSLGGYEFKTAPNHVGQFDMWISNDVSINGMEDGYSVYSKYENISIPSLGLNSSYIYWVLGDYDHTALSSDALPVTAPVLTDWEYNRLRIFIFDSDLPGSTFGIEGIVTQATLIPEPLTGVLMAMGVLFLRRGR